ncbi:cell wall-binding repeat-containing protein [Clostridium acetireducens]|uniref:cell wall-binding repeat-containing protein n=1 Tax=Clostridium acetireducens TaxID=76489 RepID=UPI0031199C29
MIVFIAILLNIFSLNTKAAEVVRIGGKTRIETANYLASKEFVKADTIILVNGWGYADAVSAVPLSKKLQAPILLTQNVGPLEEDIKYTIEKLQAKSVIIIGGKGVISEEIEKNLKTKYKVERICGTVDTTRMGTNAAVAYEVLKDSYVNTAILVNGQDGYADALTVSSIAASKGYPVLFTKSKELPNSINNIIEKYNLKILAVGGKAVLSDEILDLVRGERIAFGKDRFETNLSLLNWWKARDFSNIYVAAGGRGDKEFADGLVAASAAAKNYAPLLLSGLGANEYHIQGTLKYIEDNISRKSIISIVGGEASVSKSIEESIKNIVYKINNPDLQEIKEVEAVTKLVDFKEYGILRVKVKINGIEVSIEDLNKYGYSAEFQSDKSVFYDESISKNGELSKSNLMQIYNKDKNKIEDFSYKVVITKNKSIVAESSITEVNIIDGEFTAIDIKGYCLKLVDKSGEPEIKSGKVLVGEVLKLNNVICDTVNGRINANVTDYVTLESSNSFVISIEGKNIKALCPGEAIITIKSGVAEKKFTLTVLDNNEENKRKIFKVEPEIHSIKLAKGGSKTFKLKFKDQYGEDFLAAENGIYKDFYIKDFIQDNRDNSLANIEVINKEYDTYVKIQSTDTIDGSGDLYIYNSNGAVIYSIFIEVSEKILFHHIKLESEKYENALILDINPESARDNNQEEIKLKLNEYAEDNSFIGTCEGTEKELKTKDGAHIFNLKVNTQGKTIPYILNLKEGVISIKLNRQYISNIEECEIVVEIIEKGVIRDFKTITIKDSSPKIIESNLKNGVEGNSATIPIHSIIDCENIIIDKLSGDGNVKISKEGIIYIETNIGHDYYNYNPEEDIYLGRLVAFKKEGNIEFVNISQGNFNFKPENGEINGIVTIGVLRCHESTPFKRCFLKIVVTS